ncbi:MAG: hypoxanthine phosphoribosyltransferase [Planctomycetota bacterium]
MKQHQLHNFISASKIQKKVRSLSRRISGDYRKKKPLIVGVLNGVFIFMSDLIRHLDIPVHIDFIKVSSYGSGTVSSGKIRVLLDIVQPVKGKDVLIVDDIIDTGLTISHIRRMLLRQKPRSIKVCTLLDKPNQRKVNVRIDYCGFKIPSKFVVGYGMDFNERYRSLSDIRYLK